MVGYGSLGGGHRVRNNWHDPAKKPSAAANAGVVALGFLIYFIHLFVEPAAIEPTTPFVSVPSAALSPQQLAAALEAARQALLDIGLRNPLLNFRPSKVQGVEIIEEKATALYDILVRQGKVMYFLPAPEAPRKPVPARSHLFADADEPAPLPALADLMPDLPPLVFLTAAERQAAQLDNKLQTAETGPKLQSRLLATYYAARTSLEETGANILFLALGALTWYEDASSEAPHLAPLVLLPVQLERGTATERFKLRHSGAEAAGNLSLQAKLRATFALELPLPEFDEDSALGDYYAAVKKAVASQTRWTVEANRVSLGFFSFGKFMLYRDLDPATWPAGATLLDHPNIGALLGRETGFRDPAPSVADGAFLDTESPAADLHQVLDADSSQLLALLAVHEGRNLIIQGPPGTGKSQTIANLLAEAIGAGKKVLFVAEKMAALEVVKRRLDQMGLGAACLELHSHKANKKALLDELRQTLALGRPVETAALDDDLSQLPALRTTLNDYAHAVNAPVGHSRRSAQQIAGALLALTDQSAGTPLPRLAIGALPSWTDADATRADALATRLQATLQRTGVPAQLLFWGSQLTVLLPAEQSAIAQLLTETIASTQCLLATGAGLAALLHQPAPAHRAAAEPLLAQAQQTHREAEVAHGGQALAALATLQHASHELAGLLGLPAPTARPAAEHLPAAARQVHLESLSAHDPALHDAVAALDATSQALATLLSLPVPLTVTAAQALALSSPAELREAQAAHDGQGLQAVQALQAAARALAATIGLPPPTTAAAAAQLAPIARHLQAAPALAGVAVADAYWRQQTLPLPEAQAAAERLHALHQQYDALLLPAAWEQTLLTERGVLLAYGPKWWRWFKGSYRQARQRLQALWRGPLPAAAHELVAAIEAIEEAARHEQTLLKTTALAQRLFGAAWQGRESDWGHLAHVSRYLIDTHQQLAHNALPAAVLPCLVQAPDPAATLGQLATLETALAQLTTALHYTTEAVGPARAYLLGTAEALTALPFASQITAIEAWALARPDPAQVAAALAALEAALPPYHHTWQRVTAQLQGAEVSALAPTADTPATTALAAQQQLLRAWTTGTPAPGAVAAALAALEAALPPHEQALAAVAAVCRLADVPAPALIIEITAQSFAEQGVTLRAWQENTPTPIATLATLKAFEQALQRQSDAWQPTRQALKFHESQRFGSHQSLLQQPFAEQLALLQAWQANVPALHLAAEWNNVAAEARNAGLGDALPLAETWEPASRLLAAVVQQAWLEYLQQQAYAQHPALSRFERAGHEAQAERFRQTDRSSLLHNRIRAMGRHFDGLPTQQQGVGQLGLLRNEFARRARHLPLRRLMTEAGRAVQAIKPVFMMSPLSVASFLPPGAVDFDLVVFDEASQVRPVDAFGAVARGRQLVVVGDSKQLPPTSFFDSLTGAAAAPDDETNVTADIQSILELCKARSMPEQMLRWHYRSLHQSLIMASNHLFYNDELVIFPSPGDEGQLGLRYHHLPATHYERGTSRTNPLEAAAVADAVLHHARTAPKLTLGVVTFSTAQRQAIQDALEIRRRQHPEVEAFFARHAHEPFFVKNLENVQGDERDVILISLGYGRTKEGYVSMGFGPLNGEGGERRLNVLITRAKRRCEVFTNLVADDIDLARTKAKGVQALKVFLQFAQHGFLNHNTETGRPPDSPFEEAVQRALSKHGYTVRPQIGSQGFYIDLAVVDPDQPGRYALGIECDGAMYHSARSARDRDRLRQQVLEAVGWRLHRIWSTDWFRDPARETERAVAAIEDARRLAALDQPDQPEEFGEVELLLPPTAPAAPALAREETATAAAPATDLYQVAVLPDELRNAELPNHPINRIADWATAVVEAESPVHLDEVIRRLAAATGATQVGNRIRAAALAGIQLALATKRVRQQGSFLWHPAMPVATPPVRDRSALPAISRKPQFVAPEEMAEAVRTLVLTSCGAETTEVTLPVVRRLGFGRPNDELRQQVSTAIDYLAVNGKLLEMNGFLLPPVK